MASKPTSTGLINLQDFLRLNQGQANQLGQRVGASLDQEAARAQAGVDTVARAFETDVGAKSPTNPFAPDSGMVDLAGADQSYKDRVAAAQAAQYTGPRGIEENSGFGAAASGATAGAQLGQSMNNEIGRGVFLSQRFGKPTYTAGQMATDSFLAGAAPEGGAAMRQGQSRLMGLQGYLKGTQDRSKELVAGQDKKAEEIRAEGQRRKDYKAPVQTAPAPEPVERDVPTPLEEKRERANRYRDPRTRYEQP
jgi:hypothetical protein